jgi:glycosyltransferase involved in cell wall biosynthesis
MKIGFLIGVNDVGGAEYVSYQHVAMAQRNGFDVVVLSGGTGKFYNMIKALGVKVHVVGMSPEAWKIRPLLKGCDLVFNCNSFGIAEAVISLKNELGFVYATILHSNIKWVYDQVSRFDKETDLYYAIHQKIVDEFVEYGGCSKDKFRVIPNCVNTTARLHEGAEGLLRSARNDRRMELGLTPDDLLIGMVTRIASDKNIMDAIRIMNCELRIRNKIKLLIIGGASDLAGSQGYFDRVKRLIDQYELRGKVIITGNLEQEEVYRIIPAIDIGLNCSPSEGLPIALLEMMGAGIPCVFPSVGEIPSVLEGRGIVVPIRQRINIREIQADPCYTDAEIKLFVDAIANLTLEQRIKYGLLAKKYVNEERSLKYQEKLFIDFLNEGIMKKKQITQIKTDSIDANSTNANELLVGKKNLSPAPIPKEFPVVTVLMPVRDVPVEWVKEAIDSIVKQDYEGGIQILVVLHDCRISLRKEIYDLATLLPDEGKRLINIVEIAQDGVKFAEALDRGIMAAAGNIIVRMDSDDIALPDLVSKQVAYLEANPDVPVCGVQLEFFGAKQMITNHYPIVDRKLAANIGGHWFVNHPGVAYRKDRILAVGGYGHTATGLSEDYHLWCEVLKAGGEIHNLPEVLMKYRSVEKGWRYTVGWREFLDKEKIQLL